MASTTESAGSLNSSQKLHLLTSCQYADKLLSEVEATLAAANSKSPFPKYKLDLSPAQIKVVQDYVARMRAQMVRVLGSQGIKPPGPPFGSAHAIRVDLSFIDIAFDECRPKHMRGYGEVPESVVPELDGIVDEMQGILSKLQSYMAQAPGQDLAQRLQKLEKSGEVGQVKTLERIINEHGLVEFRPALSAIIDRLEGNAFEIAVFGRVSSGKSSLLNHIFQFDVLPVGVNPITSVPTRIVYGLTPTGTAWFANNKPEHFDVAWLPEFVTEQSNPGNAKHVTRIVVELPSPRLRKGVAFVDTPGLGSLATTGAAETLAYLPRCDLGVVLVDAGSTLTQDDLATVRTLYEAGIPARVLLSKADLLSAAERIRTVKYIAGHIHTELGLELPVHAVSVERQHADVLETWFEQEILPLYGRHVQLAEDSVRRKIGVLSEGVKAVLQTRSERAARLNKAEVEQLRKVETALRRTAGRFADIRAQGLEIADDLRSVGDAPLTSAAEAIVARRLKGGQQEQGPGEIVSEVLSRIATEGTNPVLAALNSLAHDAAEVLREVAQALDLDGAPSQEELMTDLKGMPRLDCGTLDLDFHPNGFLLKVSKGWARRNVEAKLRKQVGAQVEKAFSVYGKIFESWVRKKHAELQARFDSYADTYRAQLDRLTGGKAGSLGEDEAIRRDLEALSGTTLKQGADHPVAAD